MSRRRRVRRGPPRCQKCGAPIKWLRFRGRWKPFAPTPVMPGDVGPASYPVEGHTAWLIGELVTELQGRRETSHDEAVDEVYDMTWHQVHVCSTTPADDQEGQPE